MFTYSVKRAREQGNEEIPVWGDETRETDGAYEREKEKKDGVTRKERVAVTRHGMKEKIQTDLHFLRVTFFASIPVNIFLW